MEVIPDKARLSQNKEKIGDLVKRREQLIHLCLQKTITFINYLTYQPFVNDEQIKTDIELLASVRGIGHLTVMYLIAFLPELGQASSKQFSTLVGVA